jgi:hypothetical protein
MGYQKLNNIGINRVFVLQLYKWVYGFHTEGIYEWGVFQTPTLPEYPILP